jgi:hypothetical protein
MKPLTHVMLVVFCISVYVKNNQPLTGPKKQKPIMNDCVVLNTT